MPGKRNSDHRAINYRDHSQRIVAVVGIAVAHAAAKVDDGAILKRAIAAGRGFEFTVPPDATPKILECLGLPSRAPPLAPAAAADSIPFEWA